ncbi:MAG: hypothetical protein KC425_03625 [Anaerolineales bacterium]|nr:hypothetical protein [Anaerolineales bacterium]
MNDADVRIPISCPGCGARMGELVNRGGAVYLDVGTFLVASGKRHCHDCGRPFHFQRPKKEWRVLVQQYQQSQQMAEVGE